jgi:hypothetical protein
MQSVLTSRGLITRALVAGLFAGLSGVVFAQEQKPAPIERRDPSGAPQAHVAGPNRGSNEFSGDHLAEWMNHHRGWTLEQQRQALERDPSFRELSVPMQQRLFDHLVQLNAMDPQHRARMLALNEAMERLNPEQRSQVRGAMEQLGALPPDQRQQVGRSFREIRQLPPNQRMAAMMSPRYGGLNGAQRTTLLHLIQVEPMLPPPEPQPPR